MRGAGVRQFGGAVEVLELPGPREPRPGEVLIDVRACWVGNWDEFARARHGAHGGAIVLRPRDAQPKVNA